MGMKPFAEKTYWSRFPLARHETFLAVSSLFELPWNFGLAEDAPPMWRAASSAPVVGELCTPVELEGYSLDSVGVLGGEHEQPAEILALYFPASSRDHYIWIRHV